MQCNATCSPAACRDAAADLPLGLLLPRDVAALPPLARVELAAYLDEPAAPCPWTCGAMAYDAKIQQCVHGTAVAVAACTLSAHGEGGARATVTVPCCAMM